MSRKTGKGNAGPQPPRPVQPGMCGTCPFRQDGRAVDLAPGRLDGIRAYLIRGTPHVCHHRELHGLKGKRIEKETGVLCRGGRDWQLLIWHRMGLLEEPTDAALHRLMAGLGLWTSVEEAKG